MALQSRRTVLVVDADRTVGRHIQAALEGAGFHVPRPCGTMADALASASSAPPDAVFLELALLTETAEARELVRTIVDRRVPLVYLVPQADRGLIERAASQHATGCLVKPVTDRQAIAEATLAIALARSRATTVDVSATMTADEKLRVIRAIVGEAPGTGDSSMRRRPRPASGAGDRFAALSAREREVVDLVTNGARVATIAQRLHLSPHTVRNHLKSVFRKLNLRGQHELFEYWHDHAE